MSEKKRRKRRTVIYWFSGTGNCLSIARKVAAQLGNTDVIPLVSLGESERVPKKYDRVGFVIPTCFGHPSKLVRQIVQDLEFVPRQRIFAIVSYGGADIRTIYELEQLLHDKTRHRVQTFGVQLPGNHLVGFGAWLDRVQERLFRNADKQITRICAQIRSGRPMPRPRAWNLQVATFLSQTFNGWLGVRDIFSTKSSYYTTDACTHCGLCERLCPAENIHLVDGKVVFGDDCQQCMACIQWCPQHAIGHPNVPEDRKRYHNPEIKLKDMLLR